MLSPTPPNINRSLLTACKERFLKINTERLQRTLDSLTPRQQSCLLSIPVLLHINHPLLPGYVSQQTPAGIIRFSPSEQQIRIVENLVRSLNLQNKVIEEYAILHLSFMGSCGTIAQNKQSDLDFWVCYNPNLSESALNEFKQKLILIEKWAIEIDLEVHFFPMNAEDFRQEKHNEMSGEDCGSAQHYLLLDEFYRTSVMLGGQYPLWWWIPTEEENNYDHYAQLLFQNKIIQLEETIDLGGIPTIPAGEFIGAGMWQLYKGIESPYKSVIKILLAEIYAANYPTIHCLSHEFKNKVYKDITTLDQLDPYLMLYQTIENYLVKQNDTDRLELTRRCFYFKTTEKLSQKPSSLSLVWRRTLLNKLTTEWQWNTEHLNLLDTHDQWDLEQTSQENQMLTDALSHSYKIISDFATHHSDSIFINAADMQILNNKLSAAFDKKPEKIERLCSSLSHHLLKEHLTLLYAKKKSTQQEAWSLYSGNLNSSALTEHIPLRQCSCLIELLTWCFFNKLIDLHTHFNLHTPFASLREKEIFGTVQHFTRYYSSKALAEIPNDFHQAVQLKQLSWFVNIGNTALSESSKYGLSTISDAIDALSYSLHEINFIHSIDCLSTNTWGETNIVRFTEEKPVQIHAIAHCILKLLAQLPLKEKQQLPKISVLCFTSARSEAIIRRLNQLLAHLFECFHYRPDGKNCRYLLKVEKVFYVFYFQNQAPKVKKLIHEKDLIKFLSMSSRSSRPIVFDPHALPNHPASLISTYYRSDRIQIFYYKNFPTLDIYVIDQHCNLLHFSLHQRDVASYLAHLGRFIYLTLYRHNKEFLEHQASPPISYYEISLSKGESPKIIQKAIRPKEKTIKFYEVKIHIKPQKNKENIYTLYCDDRIFSQADYGDNLFQTVARHILSIGTNSELHPIYITDLFVENFEQPAPTVIQYLQLKLALEKQLNHAMKM